MTIKKDFLPQNHQKFREEAKALREAFEHLESEFAKARPYLGGGDEIQRLFDEHRKLIQSLASPYFHVCFGGRFSAGKSTLINALFGNQQFLPKGNKATTAFPTFIHKAAPGEAARAEISYLSEAEREQLKREYLTHLFQTMDRADEPVDEWMKLPREAFRKKLDEVVSQGKAAGKVISKSYECLHKLLRNWDHQVGAVEQGSIEEAMKIQESDDNSVVIREVKVYLEDLPYDESIVLIDLPGVEADNIRHEKITEAYCLDTNTKAFIFVYATDGLDGRSLFDLITRINNKKQSIANAFWIINKWNQDANAENLEHYFKDKMKALNIPLRDERVFKVPLLESAGTGASDEAFQAAVDALKKALFDYLQHYAYGEFLLSARKVYQDIRFRIRQAVEEIDLPEADDELRMRTINRKANAIYRGWRQTSLAGIEGALKALKERLLDGNGPAFFREEEVALIDEKLRETLAGIGVRDLIIDSSLKKVYDSEPDWAAVIQAILEKINFGLLIRNALMERMQQGLLEEINQPFASVSQTCVDGPAGNIALPAHILQRMEQVIRTQNFSYRLDGLCDALMMDLSEERVSFQEEFLSNRIRTAQKALLYKTRGDALDYTDEAVDFEGMAIDAIRREPRLQEQNSPLDDWQDQANFAIHYLRELAMKYIRRKQEQINGLVAFSMENHYKMVREDLAALIQNQEMENSLRDHLFTTLMRSPIDEEMEEERKRIVTLKAFRHFIAA